METVPQKQYSITKQKCKEMIHGVCDSCGGELEPLETVDNAGNPTFWAACLKCPKIHWGTPKEVFQIAEIMVKEKNFIAYKHMDRPEDNNVEGYREHYYGSQIAGTCSIVRDILQIKKQLES